MNREGGAETLREQFRILAGFMKSLNFINMKPVSDDVVKTGSEVIAVEGLVEEGKSGHSTFLQKIL